MNGYQGPEDYFHVHEKYFGLFETDTETDTVKCVCDDIADAIDIVNAYLVYHQNRPFSYYIKYVGNRPQQLDKMIEEYGLSLENIFGVYVDCKKYFDEILC